GRGGMGEVHVAEDRASGARVALKVLALGAGITKDSSQRFERERELLARVEHPGVVRALGALETDDALGVAFFTMELVLGKSLADLLAEHGRFAVVEAVRVLAAVAAALEATHARGIVHRDVKPSNILIARSGEVRLTDFGLARALDSSRFTATGSALGTPTYMSPEQCSAKEAGPESDLYSLGVVAHELLAGSAPFKAENPIALLKLHVEAEPPALRALRPEVPERLAALVARLLAKSPERRLPEPRAELEALHDELAGDAARFAKKVSASIDRDTVAVAALAAPERAERASRANLLGVAVIVLAGALVALAVRPGAPAAPTALTGAPAAPQAAPRATLLLEDGSLLAGEVRAIASDALTIQDERGVARVISLSSVKRIEYR